MNTTTHLRHILNFQVERDDSWAESARYPEYKPNSDKTYRPERASLSIEWEDGQKIGKQTVTVYGRRHLKSGELGADVKCTYYYYSSNETPAWVHLISDECTRIASEYATSLARP